MSENNIIYTPNHFSSKKFEDVISFIKGYPFGTIISCNENQVSNVTKVPYNC